MPAAEDKVSRQRDEQCDFASKISVDQDLTGGSDAKQDFSDAPVSDPIFTVGKSPLQNGSLTHERKGHAMELGEGSPKVRYFYSRVIVVI